MTTLTLNTIPGATSINLSGYNYRVLLKVKREGLGYDIKNVNLLVDPDNREVCWRKNIARITFLTPFAPGERVYVLIK